MQTFLPYADFARSARVLDYRRLGKQRVEAMQIHKALTDPSYGWQHHPATNMWRGFAPALAHYHNVIIAEWVHRGYNNNMAFLAESMNPVEMPPWFGDEDFHLSHRSNLLRKDFKFYCEKFPANTPIDLEYVWPSPS